MSAPEPELDAVDRFLEDAMSQLGGVAYYLFAIGGLGGGLKALFSFWKHGVAASLPAVVVFSVALVVVGGAGLRGRRKRLEGQG
jgi:hypothetical protein